MLESTDGALGALSEVPGASKQQQLAGTKVLIIVENLPVPFDRRVWQEACALRDGGAEVSIICPTGKGLEQREEVLEGIQIFRHPLPLEAKGAIGFLVEYTAALYHETRLAWKIFFGHGFGMLHLCNPPDLIFLVALPFKLLGKRVIFDHHDLNPEMYEVKFGRRGALWYALRLFEWLTFKVADVVISTNESYRSVAITRGGKHDRDVFVVRSGPDVSRLKLVPPDPSLRRGRPFLVGYVGIMGAQDGVDLLLEAARHLVHERRRRDVQFVLVGGGPEMRRLEEISKSSGLDDYVTFAGFQYGDNLNRILSSIDIGVCPDPRNDYANKCTMNKVMEYMAFGKPLVQFDLDEGRFSAREASLYAKPNDPIDFAVKISELLADEAARRRMGELGRQRIENELAWQYEVPKLIAAYKRALR